VVLPNGVTVAALVALNCGGNVVDPQTGELYGARYGLADEFAMLVPPCSQELSAAKSSLSGPSARNTVLVVVATDARLAKHESCRVAMAAHRRSPKMLIPTRSTGEARSTLSKPGTIGSNSLRAERCLRTMLPTSSP
jgi:L-aminopeptidase/D-esterase-like protein